jgi:hypothetical protein
MDRFLAEFLALRLDSSNIFMAQVLSICSYVNNIVYSQDHQIEQGHAWVYNTCLKLNQISVINVEFDYYYYYYYYYYVRDENSRDKNMFILIK